MMGVAGSFSSIGVLLVRSSAEPRSFQRLRDDDGANRSDDADEKWWSDLPTLRVSFTEYECS